MCSVPFMFCGSFSHVEDHEDPWAPATPRKSNSKRKDSKNPYSSRGLDKFATVLAELEAKRAKITAQLGSQEAWVRFVYSNSNDWVPIVVKLKGPKAKKVEEVAQAKLHQFQISGEKANGGETPEKKEVQKVMKKCFSWKAKEDGLRLLRWRPRYQWPAVLVLILLCVVMFGRSFAIICTSILWYMVPSLTGDSANMRKSMMRMSAKKLGGDHHHLIRSSQPKKLGTA